MSDHRARLSWQHHAGDFPRGTYSRKHRIAFDCGTSIEAGPAEGNAPPGLANPECVDPEEAFVAAIASCHLLTFLWVAYRGGFAVASYDDEAVGVMAPDAAGRKWVSLVTLHPRITWSGTAPTAEALRGLHERAHEECFIANSVRTAIRVAEEAAPAETPAGSAP